MVSQSILHFRVKLKLEVLQESAEGVTSRKGLGQVSIPMCRKHKKRPPTLSMHEAILKYPALLLRPKSESLWNDVHPRKHISMSDATGIQSKKLKYVNQRFLRSTVQNLKVP